MGDDPNAVSIGDNPNECFKVIRAKNIQVNLMLLSSDSYDKKVEAATFFRRMLATGICTCVSVYICICLYIVHVLIYILNFVS